MADNQLGALFVDLVLDKDGKYQVALRNAQKQSVAASKAIQNALGGLSGMLATIGIGAIVNESIKAFGEAQKSVDSLSAAIGGSAAYNDKWVKSLTKASTAIMNKTVLDDDAVTSAMAYGRQIGIQTEQLDQAAIAAVGLSYKLKIDLDGAMKIIQKASIGNVTALTKLGVNIDTTATKEQKLAAVMALGADGFKQAEAYAKTTAGQMERFHIAVGNASEKLGSALLPFLHALLKTAQPIIEWFSQISPKVIEGILGIGTVLFVFVKVFKWVKAITIGWVGWTQAIAASKAAMGDAGAAAFAAGAAALAVGIGFAVVINNTDDAVSGLGDATDDYTEAIKNMKDEAASATQAIVKVNEAANAVSTPTVDPRIKEAERIKEIIMATREATKAEQERKRAMVGAIDIQEIGKKATEAGLRERFGTAISGMGDLASRAREQTGAAGRNLYTRLEVQNATRKAASEDSTAKASLQALLRIVMIMQDQQWSGDRGTAPGYGW